MIYGYGRVSTKGQDKDGNTGEIIKGAWSRDYLYGLSRLPARSVRSMSAAGARSPPRRAQNLLAGCIFVGIADKSAFALLSKNA